MLIFVALAILVSSAILLVSSSEASHGRREVEGNETSGESKNTSCFAPAMVGLEIFSKRTDAITFKWHMVWSDDKVKYVVRWATSDGGCVAEDCKPSGQATTTGKHFTLDGLEPFTQVCLTVTPHITVGDRCNGPARTLCSRILPLDHTIWINEVGVTTVRFGWKKQEGASGYSIRYCTRPGPCSQVDMYAEDANCRERHASENDTLLTLNNVKPWTSVLLKVVPYRTLGVECFTTRIGRPSVPRELKARKLAESGIIVYWKPPEKPNGPISKYRVEIREQNSYDVYADDVEDTFYPIENLNRSVVYIVQVRAVNYDDGYRLDIWGEMAIVRVSFKS